MIKTVARVGIRATRAAVKGAGVLWCLCYAHGLGTVLYCVYANRRDLRKELTNGLQHPLDAS